MAKFAKLIELDNDEQVLLTVNYNDDDDNFEVSIRTDLECCAAQIKLVPEHIKAKMKTDREKAQQEQVGKGLNIADVLRSFNDYHWKKTDVENKFYDYWWNNPIKIA